MMRTKAFTAVGALAMLAAVACSADRTPLAPQAATPAAEVSLDRSAGGVRADAAAALPSDVGVGTSLLRRQPLASDITVSKNIGPAGGELEIPQAGLTVYVPRGAVTRNTPISATALKGDMIAYEFGPHGTKFMLPLVVTQKVAGTDFDALPPGTLVQLGYFTGPQSLDRTSKRVRVAEWPTFGISTGRDVAFLVWHFSGYAVQWGFKDNDDDQGRDGRRP